MLIGDVIIKGSENVFPVIIENEISSLAGIKDVAVVGVEHEFWGEIIVGCVILDENLDATNMLNKLKEYAPKKLSNSYQPDKWLIVKKFPCTSTGKIKKNILSKEIRDRIS